MVVLMSILTWDQIEEFRSGTETSIFSLFTLQCNSRKLFEPKSFPEATVLKIFEKYFGKFEERDPREVRR